MTNAPRKVLIARVDRIGDLVLTLPMENAWGQGAPADKVYWLVSENTKFLFESHPHKERVFTGKDSGELKTILRRENFDVVLSVHVPWWMAFEFWKAQIPLRVGVASKWYSWFLYNKRVRQRRSQGLKNEALYNLELVSAALNIPTIKLKSYDLAADEEKRKIWKSQLGEGFIVIHPGMGGSARNWPLHHYRELAEKLISSGSVIVVTGSALDKKIIDETEILKVPGVINLVEKTPPPDLLAVLSLASTVIAPSTGVAHMAAALGVRTFGIYSPVRVQAPLRWAPLGREVKVFVPNVNCPGIFNCLGPACPHYDCMVQIDVDTVVKSVLERKT